MFKYYFHINQLHRMGHERHQVLQFVDLRHSPPPLNIPFPQYPLILNISFLQYPPSLNISSLKPPPSISPIPQYPSSLHILPPSISLSLNIPLPQYPSRLPQYPPPSISPFPRYPSLPPYPPSLHIPFPPYPPLPPLPHNMEIFSSQNGPRKHRRISRVFLRLEFMS